ncbi:ACT domain-containing protein [Desulfosporosinus sp. Sb-LF]|uniref:ACT domain-containing protein n=1 Tax=Desulfosporosinus sp. Sb-LF TaxID=2560027 RepID=UPI00107F3FC1|nr:ACT domain-containing protein [Desulfosporosinus sp. Sb-LF]TGE34330.1 ACT domain-containing protein [Desulfosporosinus sp. Sb-LF]
MAGRTHDFLIVSKAILPEAILKTAEAKELLVKGDVDTINDAVERVGLSRSAYYKYKDGVFPFYEASRERIITISLALENKAGVLSHVLNFIASVKGNILTINQGIPLQGIANVSVSLETAEMADTPENLLTGLGKIHGVRKIEVIGQT